MFIFGFIFIIIIIININSIKKDMNTAQQQTLKQAIRLLQILQTGGNGPDPDFIPQDLPIPEYDVEINKFYQKGKTLQPEIQKLTEYFHTASETMKKIMIYSEHCQRYTAAQEEKLKNVFFNLSNQIQNILKKSVDFVDHCKAMKQLISATFWVFTISPEYIFNGAIQGADFNALKFQKKKNQQHNQWWALASNSCKLLKKFIVKKYPSGISFNFEGENKWNQIISGESSAKNNNTKPSKNVPEKAIQQQQPTSNPTVQPKPPKKQLIGLNWQLRNYQNTNITLSKQIQMKHGIFIQNCNKCHITIQSKFKSININKCNDFTLFIKSCVSGVQLMNCKNITVVVEEKTPSISVDKCERVKLTLNENHLDTDIVSCKANQLNVSYGNTKGEESKAHLISDQLITKWNPQTKKFQTKIYDKFL